MMKRHLWSLVLVLFLMVSTVIGGTVQAYLSTCTFNVPGKGPYLETYLSVVGRGVTYLKKDNGKYQGAIEVSIIVRRDTIRVYRDRYNLLSPETDDTTKNLKEFIDEQRIPLPNGDYELDISITDKNNRTKPFETKPVIHINYPENAPALSDIELLESYTKSSQKSILTKNGYDLVPYVSNFYSKNINDIKFYAEIYNSSYFGSDKFLVKYYIEQYNSKRMIGQFSHFVKMTPEVANIIMADVPIDSLASGNYNLVVEVRNKKDEMVAKKELFFQRSNPDVVPVIKPNDYMGIDINQTFVANYNNKDTLFEMILCLRPIANQTENDFTDTYFQKDVPSKDTLLMKKYFYDFWVTRITKETPDPKELWLKYREEVIKVNKIYGNAFRKGYDTDRGRVYLQYGPPNIIAPGIEDPSALPYEVWMYYKIKDMTNKRFLFYEPNQGNNEFVLLHSDVKGEIYRPEWEKVLYGRSYQSNSVDEMTAPNLIGDKALDLFNNPR